MNSLILVAAGQGSRMGAPVNKLLLKHRGLPLISYTLRHVFQSRFLEELIIVARVEEQPLFADILKRIEHHIPVRFAPGGATRMQSVKNGLSCLSKDSEKVLVHDGRAHSSMGRPLMMPLLPSARHIRPSWSASLVWIPSRKSMESWCRGRSTGAVSSVRRRRRGHFRSCSKSRWRLFPPKKGSRMMRRFWKSGRAGHRAAR